MNKLPKRLKSGRRLVATAADRHVGLYRGGTKEDRTWRIAFVSGKVKRGMLGSKGYPLAPKGQKWTWLRTKKRRKLEREAKHARVHADPRAGRLPEKKQKELPISKTKICVDCGRDPTRKASHSHTYSHETKGYAVTLCCRCARKKRGYKCPIRKQARLDRKRAEYEAEEKRLLLKKQKRNLKKFPLKLTVARKKKRKRHAIA